MALVNCVVLRLLFARNLTPDAPVTLLQFIISYTVAIATTTAIIIYGTRKRAKQHVVGLYKTNTDAH